MHRPSLVGDEAERAVARAQGAPTRVDFLATVLVLAATVAVYAVLARHAPDPAADAFAFYAEERAR